MPVSGYTYNKNLVKISAGSTDNWDVWYNQAMDQLDEPSMHYKITAAEDLAAGEVAAALDDGTGAKKAYLAASGTYTFGDPLGIAVETVTAGNPVRLTMAGRVQNAGWAFGAADKFAYLSASGTVTTTDTGNAIGFVLSSTSIYFHPGSSSASGGRTDTVAGSNGLANTGDNVDAVLSPVYGTAANTVCEGDDARLHSQNTDGGTNAASFEINYAANSARLLTTGLTANRDYTFPDATTKLVGEGAAAAITAGHDYSGGALRLPASSGAPSSANDEGDVVFDTVNDDLYVGLGSTTWKKINQAGGAGRNLLINGGMNLAQRGTSFTSATTPANDDDTYLMDRWILLSDGADVADVSQSSTAPAGAKHSMALDVATVNKKFGVLQVVESEDAVSVIGGTASLSFDAKVTDNGAGKLDNVKAVVLSWDGTADAVTSDVVSAWGAEDVTPAWAANWTAENTPANLNVATSFATYRIENISIDTANAKNVAVLIWCDGLCGTAGETLNISRVKLEPGAAATPFTPAGATYAQEVAMAHRYYWRWNPKSGQVLYQCYAAAASAQYRWPLVFPTEMRAAPAVTVNGTWASVNVASWGVVGAATTEQGCVVNIQSTSSGSTYVYPNSTDDNIEADAEL